ncbi:hypothetical protein TRVA0_031S00298 [Trichomonascus vanleenenianus]|uniref:uncharacterized protein n=1 Tax=Trichomonascus vanleenenianus TaxID=2268995 RepID=UPI003EC9E808
MNLQKDINCQRWNQYIFAIAMTDFLSQLPTELLTMISKYLTDDGRSALSLGLANKQLYSTICPMLFKNITAKFGYTSVLSNGFKGLRFTYEDSATMMKAVDCEFTQYFRQVEIYIGPYSSDYDEVLKYLLSMTTLSHIRLSLTAFNWRLLKYLPLIPPSTQVDVNLTVSFEGVGIEIVSWLDRLVAQAPENINFNVCVDLKFSHRRHKLIDLKGTPDQKIIPVPPLFARMETMALYFKGDCNVSELNKLLSFARDPLREVQLRAAEIVVDQPCLMIPNQVSSLHYQCHVSGPNQLTITGKSLKKLVCNALRQSVKVDAQIVDLTVTLMEEERNIPPIVAERYGITSGTDSISIEAHDASTLRIKDLVRAAPSKLTITYWGLDVNCMMQTLVSQATESQLTAFELRTNLNVPDFSTIVSPCRGYCEHDAAQGANCSLF